MGSSCGGAKSQSNVTVDTFDQFMKGELDIYIQESVKILLDEPTSSGLDITRVEEDIKNQYNESKNRFQKLYKIKKPERMQQLEEGAKNRNALFLLSMYDIVLIESYFKAQVIGYINEKYDRLIERLSKEGSIDLLISSIDFQKELYLRNEQNEQKYKKQFKDFKEELENFMEEKIRTFLYIKLKKCTRNSPQITLVRKLAENSECFKTENETTRNLFKEYFATQNQNNMSNQNSQINPQTPSTRVDQNSGKLTPTSNNHMVLFQQFQQQQQQELSTTNTSKHNQSMSELVQSVMKNYSFEDLMVKSHQQEVCSQGTESMFNNESLPQNATREGSQNVNSNESPPPNLQQELIKSFHSSMEQSREIVNQAQSVYLKNSSHKSKLSHYHNQDQIDEAEEHEEECKTNKNVKDSNSIVHNLNNQSKEINVQIQSKYSTNIIQSQYSNKKDSGYENQRKEGLSQILQECLNENRTYSAFMQEVNNQSQLQKSQQNIQMQSSTKDSIKTYNQVIDFLDNSIPQQQQQ